MRMAMQLMHEVLYLVFRTLHGGFGSHLKCNSNSSYPLVDFANILVNTPLDLQIVESQFSCPYNVSTDQQQVPNKKYFPSPKTKHSQTYHIFCMMAGVWFI